MPKELSKSANGAYDGLSRYMTEASKTPLLTREEEVALAKRIIAGTISNNEFTPDAQKAIEHMTKANLRLVIKIAKDYTGYGLPVADLIAEGNLGLLKGVKRFDPDKGGKLSTYAAWWIKQHIKRALSNQGKTIRLPVHAIDKIAKINRIKRILGQALGRDATDDEVAEELGTETSKITSLLRMANSTLSLDAPMGDDNDTCVGELIKDPNAIDPLNAATKESDLEQLDGLLERLSPRERLVIEARYGLNGTTAQTLEEVGELLKVTRERVRQIQNKALEKMQGRIGKKEIQTISLPPGISGETHKEAKAQVAFLIASGKITLRDQSDVSSAHIKELEEADRRYYENAGKSRTSKRPELHPELG